MPADTLTREIFGNIGQGPKLVFYGLAVLALLIGGRGLARMIRRWNSGQRSGTVIDWKSVPSFTPRVSITTLPNKRRQSTYLTR